MELNINGEIYEFKAGFGFMRELNATVTTPVDGLKKEEKIGMTYHFAKLIDGDIETLETILLIMNKGCSPRLKPADLEAYLEDESTDIDELFSQVKDFLSKSNVCKSTMNKLLPQEK